MRRGRRLPSNTGLGLAGSALVHGLVGALLFAGAPRHRTASPPIYKVQLLAAPAPAEQERRAPEAVERPAAEQPAPLPKPTRQPRSAASHAAPPPSADAKNREAAPRTTPKATPLLGDKPSTGTDAATVSTEGVEFPHPEYLQNIVSQIRQRWERPSESTPLEAEVSFFIHRDGSITDLQFIKRSGNFGFDLQAQGAVEETGRFKAFGSLPDGWTADVLFVRFYFSGKGR